VNLPCTFVGHPLVEKKLDQVDPHPLAKRLGWTGKGPLVCVLPGSRQGEIKRHLPIFLDTVERLRHQYHDLAIVLPTLPHLRAELETQVLARDIPAFVVTDLEDKYAAMRLSTAALAASGTVTLELGLCQTPHVVGYRVNPLTAAIVRHMITVDHVSLVNILLEHDVVPERLQENFTAENLYQSLLPLLDPASSASQHQKQQLALLPDLLAPSEGLPSQVAAQVIKQLLFAS
jgi:lipid-A-disaccharide synthase